MQRIGDPFESGGGGVSDESGHGGSERELNVNEIDLDRLLARLEDRVMEEVARRGGRQAGWF
ncbi:MAG: hypothetical protein AB8G26_12670 [Ilumatobacter sp.]